MSQNPKQRTIPQKNHLTPYTTILKCVSHVHEDFPPDIQDTTTTAHRNTPEYNVYPDKIPELEDDWDNGQFGDAESTLITHHNTHSESKRIRWDSCWI